MRRKKRSGAGSSSALSKKVAELEKQLAEAKVQLEQEKQRLLKSMPLCLLLVNRR